MDRTGDRAADDDLVGHGSFLPSPASGFPALSFASTRATIVADDPAFKRKNPAGHGGRNARPRARRDLRRRRRTTAARATTPRIDRRIASRSARAASQVSAAVATHKDHLQVLELTCVDLAIMLVVITSIVVVMFVVVVPVTSSLGDL